LSKVGIRVQPGSMKQLPLFDLTPRDVGKADVAGSGASRAGGLRVGLPRDFDATMLGDLRDQCGVDAGHTEKYLRMWRERNAGTQDAPELARLRRLYEHEVRFNAFLAGQLNDIQHGYAGAIDLSLFAVEEWEAFKVFLKREIRRLQVLVLDIELLGFDGHESRFSLKLSFLDHLRTALEVPLD
jgi:hypothetical protein